MNVLIVLKGHPKRATFFLVVNHSRIDIISQDKLGSPFASVEYIDIDTGPGFAG